MIIDNKLKVRIYATPMIPLEYVKKLEWSKKYGEKIKSLRESKYYSRNTVIKKMSELCAETLSESWLRKLENGLTDTIDLDLAIPLLQALGEGLEFLYPVISLSKEGNS